MLHLLKSGFEPLIHPHGITESYVFINSSLNSSYFCSLLSAIRDRLMKRFFDQNSIDIPISKICAFSSLGDHMFLPFTHIGGSIHASQLQSFRETFMSAYLIKLLVADDIYIMPIMADGVNLPRLQVILEDSNLICSMR